MIPLQLRISGFLSYRDPTELDFTGFDLACISGSNGAGKSTLLDAITWALFGQARRRDDALINQQSEAAEVTFTFRYEDTDYRVLRSLRRGKPGMLEFQVRRAVPDGSEADRAADPIWRPLTERTQKETQARIEEVLRLDYETFVNASFFLQGKADLFTQQSPARRKGVLSNILGMEVWEGYRARASDMRRRREAELASVVGRLGEIGSELAEEGQRKQRLAELETELSRLVGARKAQASVLESARAAHAVLERQRALLGEQMNAMERTREDLASLRTRLEERGRLRREISDLTTRSEDIEVAHAAWLEVVAELERLDGISRAFRDRERERLPYLQEITAEQARLAQERSHLMSGNDQLQDKAGSLPTLEAELGRAAALLAQVEAQARERDEIRAQVGSIRERIAENSTANKILREKMEEIKDRIGTLEAASGAACPLCGQPLSRVHRRATLKRLRLEGKQHGDQFRLNAAAVQELRNSEAEAEARLVVLSVNEDQRMARSRSAAQLTERLAALRSDLDAWESTGRRRLDEVNGVLATGAYAAEARARLSAIDTALAKLGYDAVTHDAVRSRENELRQVQEVYAKLQSARAALEPVESEIRSIESQIAERAMSLARQDSEVRDAQAALESAAAGLPDLATAERLVFELQEQENRLNQEVGAARQKVAVLQDLRRRNADLESGRQALALSISRSKVLEGALGKDGVPALLIEQALPEVESHANEILDRLSDGRMSVHFETQAAYRDHKREDLRETLDITISDGSGKRDYEMYSGGEAFRVDFAIRLALSQVLAGRKGARLQTLVIDEGFASQDNQGIQRLIETINLIRHDFAKILLISHLDELKDAFPTRIEVEKTERGSVLRVS